MKMNVRRGKDRGHARHGWLDSHHTFSFASYYDPRHMGFRTLRVLNEDRVARGAGFPAHPHRDMEIISYVLDGALEHKDSMGNGSVIRPGDVQRMSAGTGVVHSEFNASRDDEVHFLQIWILPEERGLEPSYEQRRFETDDRRNVLRLVASRDGRDGSITVHQDMSLYTTLLEPGRSVTHALGADRHAWIHVAKGEVRTGDTTLAAGDSAAVSDASSVTLTGVSDAEVLLFDLT